MYHTALALRREHPTWGSGYIHVRLRMTDPDPSLPAERTLRDWFRKAGLSAAPAGRRPSLSLDRATRPHQVWQMDASEYLRLKSGNRVCWLRVIDEFSGAILWTRVFNKARWETVPALETQQALRKTFRRWGIPRGFRVDNGFPWGTSKDLPTDLTLWLIGLDIAMDYNPPSCPQKNGVVERSMRTSQNWAEPGQCASWQELQQRVDEADQIQREVYPLAGAAWRLSRNWRARIGSIRRNGNGNIGAWSRCGNTCRNSRGRERSTEPAKCRCIDSVTTWEKTEPGRPSRSRSIR